MKAMWFRFLVITGGAVLAACADRVAEPFAPAAHTAAAVPTVQITVRTDTFNAIGDTRDYSAEARAANGVLVATPALLWTRRGAPISVDDNRAGVMTSTRTGAGWVRVQWHYQGVYYRDSIPVVVRQVPATLALADDALTMVRGDTATLVASMADSNGVAIPATQRKFGFTSNNTASAVVSLAGRVTARAAGSAVITVTPLGKPSPSATAQITVNAPPPPRQIAFCSNRDGNMEIYKMSETGANQTRLTNDPANDCDPSWSAENNLIVFTSTRVSHRHIYRMSSAGTNVIPLTTGNVFDSAPMWSPDGTRIAFVRQVEGNFTQELWVMDAGGSNQTQLTFGSNLISRPTWSPDGTRIAFNVQTSVSDIFSLELANPLGGWIPVTNLDSPSSFAPDWAPNGRIGYVLFGTLFTVNPDGTGLATLGNPLHDFIAYSGDGVRIANQRNCGDCAWITLVDANGLNEVSLTPVFVSGVLNTRPAFRR